MSQYELAALIAKNNADEQAAIAGYNKVLATPGLPQELYMDIQEIISDEMHHGKVLSAWVTRLSGIKPAIT